MHTTRITHTTHTQPTSTEEVLTERVLLNAGQAVTQLPLTVLINENSASASEILAGALHDNARAELIGRTSYGKGRMQSVYELDDGSALFVTVAKYKTPQMNEIDKVGIKPDMSCTPPRPAKSAPRRGAGVGPATAAAQPLGGAAETGGPADTGPTLGYSAAFAGGAALEKQLQGDSCVLTAEAVLESKMLQGGPGGPPVIAKIGSISQKIGGK